MCHNVVMLIFSDFIEVLTPPLSLMVVTLATLTERHTYLQVSSFTRIV